MHVILILSKYFTGVKNMFVRKRPWSSRYGWIWYNSKEILRDTQEDIDALVKDFADKGINILIGFSCTHFRWNFYRHWDKINECIGKLVKACHKYGIIYVEHHSCHLTFNPLNEDDLVYMKSVLGKRDSYISDWPGLLEDATGDFYVDGKMISTFRQISGKTGKWGISTYHGYGMCFNNPDYVAAYLKYLESLYAVGIDGIMTDDVQYFGNDGMGWREFNACTCVHCREKFKKQYGYDLPSPSEWKDFYWNFNNPVFIAWKRFKDESTLEFVYKVKKHYEDLGLNQFRPNYISSILTTNKTAYPFEKCADVWDCVFQENCASSVIKESYLSFALESLHRFNLGRLNKIPSMSMFYPVTKDALYFSWALAKSWGQLYTGCGGEGEGGTLDEKWLRDFEIKNMFCYTNPAKISDLAFMLSFDTRDYSNGCETHQKNFVRWLQASYLSGIATDMIFENAKFKEFAGYKRIVCAHTVMLCDSVLKKLRRYVREGGHLITIGEFGKYRPDGSLRSRVGFGRKSGVLGKGKVTVLPDDACCKEYHWVFNIYRMETDHKVATAQAPPYAVDALRATGGKALLDVISDDTVMKLTSKQDVYASLLKVRRGYALNIVNVQDTVTKSGPVSHVAPIPAFVKGAKPIKHDIFVKINMDIPVKKITLHSPERSRCVNIPFVNENGVLTFTIPKNKFAGYALVKIK
jgi:hypothetical protein